MTERAEFCAHDLLRSREPRSISLFCSLRWIRHDASPKETTVETVPRWLWLWRQPSKKPLRQVLVPAPPFTSSRVILGLLSQVRDQGPQARHHCCGARARRHEIGDRRLPLAHSGQPATAGSNTRYRTKSCAMLASATTRLLSPVKADAGRPEPGNWDAETPQLCRIVIQPRASTACGSSFGRPA